MILARVVCESPGAAVELVLTVAEMGDVFDVAVIHGQSAALVRRFTERDVAVAYFAARVAAYDMAAGK